MRLFLRWFAAVSVCLFGSLCSAAVPAVLSGIYPHLAYYNNEAECGTGGVVPWANRLWVITYGPHLPSGSTDKLYEIDRDLRVTIRPESVGGTPANRMLHRESRQLLIGPYLIDTNSHVRVITPSRMPGRLTGSARHLSDPTNKVYYATMEEGFYEVDVHSLAVTQLYQDANSLPNHAGDLLPGYHGKGLYSGEGRLVYANNGELSKDAQTRPDITSGCLAEWDGKNWRVIRRNQFTEVTGPGGIYGNPNPEKDPLWSIGWDHRSLILMLLDQGTWHAYRLPKASHTYDGAHGWNTEWPRIRDIGTEGKPDLMMTMHGMFWKFPNTFSAANSSGIAPRSTYLKVIGDFCRWNERVVLGCDDTAKSEFLNKRKAKGNLEAPGQSHSNLWFVEPEQLDGLGVPIGRGGVWVEEDVKAGETSDPYLFSGFSKRGLHLSHDAEGAVIFSLEIDRTGNGEWHNLQNVQVPAHGYRWLELTEKGVWIRLKVNRDAARTTAFFQYSNEDKRPDRASTLFEGLAEIDQKACSGGLLRAQGENKRTLSFVAQKTESEKITDVGYYELDGNLKLRRVEEPTTADWVRQHVAIPTNVIVLDNASVLLVDDHGKRWRLPKGDPAFDRPGAMGAERIDREVCTERDLLNCHGTFYELPAENAGGWAKIRPIATHSRRIKDYCSYRGMLVLAGLSAEAKGPHIIRSDDGQCALWAGAVDDLWQLGKARGQGGPWKETAVQKGKPSDPYLMTGYDKKRVTLAQSGQPSVSVRLEVDVTGTGIWKPYRTFDVATGRTIRHTFPAAFQAYWVRAVANQDCKATVQFTYE